MYEIGEKIELRSTMYNRDYIGPELCTSANQLHQVARLVFKLDTRGRDVMSTVYRQYAQTVAMFEDQRSRGVNNTPKVTNEMIRFTTDRTLFFRDVERQLIELNGMAQSALATTDKAIDTVNEIGREVSKAADVAHKKWEDRRRKWNFWTTEARIEKEHIDRDRALAEAALSALKQGRTQLGRLQTALDGYQETVTSAMRANTIRFFFEPHEGELIFNLKAMIEEGQNEIRRKPKRMIAG